MIEHRESVISQPLQLHPIFTRLDSSRFVVVLLGVNLPLDHPECCTTPLTLRRRQCHDRKQAVTLFHALSDETRLAVLDLLQNGEQCVCELQADLSAAQSRLSFHLKVLRDAGLVTDRKEGRWSYYSIVPHAVAQAHDLLLDLFPATQKSNVNSNS